MTFPWEGKPLPLIEDAIARARINLLRQFLIASRTWLILAGSLLLLLMAQAYLLDLPTETMTIPPVMPTQHRTIVLLPAPTYPEDNLPLIDAKEQPANNFTASVKTTTSHTLVHKIATPLPVISLPKWTDNSSGSQILSLPTMVAATLPDNSPTFSLIGVAEGPNGKLATVSVLIPGQETKLLDVSVGDIVENTYRVTDIKPTQLTLRHLKTKRLTYAH